MRVSVTVDDTTIEIEDDEPYTHDAAARMLTTAIGQVCVAYEAALHLGKDEPPRSSG